MAEDEGKDQRGDDGLQNDPQRPEQSLFELRNKIAAHKKQKQLTVFPNAFQIDMVPLVLGVDDKIPIQLGGIFGRGVCRHTLREANYRN